MRKRAAQREVFLLHQGNSRMRTKIKRGKTRILSNRIPKNPKLLGLFIYY